MAEDKDCGCGERISSDTTRREFLQQATVLGVGLTAAVMAGTAALPVEAAPAFDIKKCHDDCEADDKECVKRVRRSKRGDVWKAVIGYPGCAVAYGNCMYVCRGKQLAEAAKDVVDWIVGHPEAVIGTIVVIGVIVFVVVATNGGALVLAPIF